MQAVDSIGLIDDARIEAIFAPWRHIPLLALAVSGGADSTALLLLAERWVRLGAGRPELLVLTVDHGLRPESAGEAAGVAAIAGRLGLACRVLRWEGPFPTSDIEGAAREARYSLMIAAAKSAGATHLATAHHRDDQAETFLMRLARGSGVYGLASMATEIERDGVRIIRPLLALTHAELELNVLTACSPLVTDPHNFDPFFARSRMRALMPLLAAEGLDADTLAATANRMRRTAAAIDHYAQRLFERAAIVDPMGSVRLRLEDWQAEPEETRLRSLARILRAVGGAPYTPRLESLRLLASAMMDPPAPERFQRTLAGVVVDRRRDGFRFQREFGRTGLPEIVVDRRFDGVWDGRFHLRIDHVGDPLTIGPLTGEGRRALAVCVPEGLPRTIDALPAIRREGRILAVPHLGIATVPASELTVEAVSLVGSRLMDGVKNGES